MTGGKKIKKEENPDKDKIIFLNGFLALIKESHVKMFYHVDDNLQRLEFKDGTSITMKTLMDLMAK